MFFSIVLRKPVGNLYACNCAHVTSTHAVNVSACLLWMDFTVCSTIHSSRHQRHDRHEQGCQVQVNTKCQTSWNRLNAVGLDITIWVIWQKHSGACE